MPWLTRIAGARTQEEVLEIAREHLAQLSPSERAQLPEECVPDTLASPEHLRAYAYRLVAHHGHGDNARLVRRLAEFFSEAAVRLNQLGAGDRSPLR